MQRGHSPPRVSGAGSNLCAKRCGGGADYRRRPSTLAGAPSANFFSRDLGYWLVIDRWLTGYGWETWVPEPTHHRPSRIDSKWFLIEHWLSIDFWLSIHRGDPDRVLGQGGIMTRHSKFKLTNTFHATLFTQLWANLTQAERAERVLRKMKYQN